MTISARPITFGVTIYADDGDTELDVACTPTDGPDALTGIKAWDFELRAARPLSVTEQDRALAAARAWRRRRALDRAGGARGRTR